jgi:hypothetical protein
MKVWYINKEKKWIEYKEFMSRWKEGINAVTPLEQTRSQIVFSWITIIGIICGIVATAFAFKNLWWVIIILVAALGNSIVSLIGINQKYTILKAHKKLIEDMNSQMDMGEEEKEKKEMKGGNE